MKLIIYSWNNGYFQIDTQTEIFGLSSTPVIDGYSDWQQEEK